MTAKNDDCCRRIRASIRLLIRRNGPRVDRDLFNHSLPTPTPTDSRDIFDIILQLILLLIEEFKPDNGDNGNNGETAFPDLAHKAKQLALDNVDHHILSPTAKILSDTIALTVHNLTTQPPPSLRLARETIRQENHAALGHLASQWAEWNDELRDHLDVHADAARLNTLSNYLDAWTQISKGLGQIK